MDYANTLFESVKIISESLLEGLKFDKTIECTIIDDSQRNKGTYVVSDGSVTFTVYSENTSYRNNTSVYVTIPNGDYDNDKIISGKKLKSNSSESFIYNSPFGSLVDVTGNLVEVNYQSGDLIANLPSTYYSPFYGEITNENYQNYFIKNNDDTFSIATSENADFYYEQFTNGLSRLIFEKRFETPFYGFTRLGLQASFQAWLREYNCIKGNYGLKVTVEFSPKGSLTQEQQEPMIRELYLDTVDMIGDPYGFETYYNQEKVFDITPYGGVSYIKIEFFQDAGSFINKNGEQISYVDDFENLVFSNLFVKDCRVCLGYELTSYEDEFVQIFSFDASTYTSAASVEDNKKDIELKWIHINEEGNQEMMSNDSSYQYEIRWYRYILGEESADGYCGPSWTNPTHSRNKDMLVVENNPFYAHLNPDTGLQATEQIKAIILFGPPPGYSLQEKVTSTAFNANKIKYYIYENGNYINCKNLEYSDQQNYYTQNADTRRVFHSNILEFTNQNNVVNSATLDAIQALSLICKDYEDGLINDSYGNYYLYNQINHLIDEGQAKITRLIFCQLDLSSKDDSEDLNSKDVSIIWKFPLNNTMIKSIDKYEVFEEDENYGIITMSGAEAVQSASADYGIKLPCFRYTIEKNYTQSRYNNFIECTVIKDGIGYHSVKELSFGQSGTAGTNWKFDIDIDDGVNAIIPNALTGGEITVTARLYDTNGKQQDISDKTIEWRFLDPADTSKYRGTTNADTHIQIVETGTSYRRKLEYSKDLAINELYILTATLTDWEDYDLTALLAIPIRSSAEYSYLSGPVLITYLTDGTPTYWNSYYELHTVTSNISNSTTFLLNVGKEVDDDEEVYLPDIELCKNAKDEKLGYKLKPVSMYVAGLPIVGVKCIYNDQTVWSQPIIVIENSYPAAMINQWNGKDLVLDQNGAIISKMLGAGKKDINNKFSGVLIGDWSNSVTSGTSMDQHTGVFGFHEGAMSYSLTDDGKVTIGKSAAGQIKFDGNSGQITSNSYANTLDTSNRKGLIIDLDDGYIQMQNTSTYEKISLTASTYIKNYYYIYKDNKYILSTEDFNSATVYYKLKSYFIELNAAADKQNGYPLQVGERFKVKWDGSAIIGNCSVDSNGVLQVPAANITGQLTASQINATNLKVSAANITGQLTASQINATNLQVSAANITGTLVADKIYCDDIYTTGNATMFYNNQLKQNYVATLDCTKINFGSGYISNYNGSTGKVPTSGVGLYSAGGIVAASSGGAKIACGTGSIWVSSSSAASTVPFTSPSAGGSDIRLKEDVSYDLSYLKPLFFDLKPVTYKFLDSGYCAESNLYIGFIAQDVLQSLDLYGQNKQWDIVSTFGDVDKDGNQRESRYNLSYNSLFTLNTYMLQEAYKEIDELKREIKELKEKIL